MESIFKPRWSSLLLRGAVSVLFGIAALMRPGITLVALTFLFGAYAFADGVVALIVAVHRGAQPHRWLLALDGLVGIGVGVVTLLRPDVTLLMLLLLIGIRFAVAGALQVAAAIQMRHEIEMPWLYGLAGVASLAFGVLTFVFPGVSAVVLVRMLAIFALVFGAMMVGLAFRVRSATHRIHVHAAA